MEITLMSDQALINELLSPGHAEPMAADSHPYIQAALPLATQASQQQRLRRILDLSKELLMRDLRHDWILRPMVNSPAAFKEWLRLRFANLTRPGAQAAFQLRNALISCLQLLIQILAVFPCSAGGGFCALPGAAPCKIFDRHDVAPIIFYQFLSLCQIIAPKSANLRAKR